MAYLILCKLPLEEKAYELTDLLYDDNESLSEE